MKRSGIFSLCLLMLLAAGACYGQARLRLTPAKDGAIVTLSYSKRSVKLDLDEKLLGTNGTLPGNEPHQFKILFTTEKTGHLYLVAKVCSASPITNPMAACGGDSPCSILWIKTDKLFKEPEVQSEIYASCSYNYYDSKFTLTKTGLDIVFGGREKKRMTYDNANAEKGLVIAEAGPGN